MRIGAMVVVFSLAVSLPAFADPDSAAPANAPATSAQAAPAAPAAQPATAAPAAPVAQADATPNLDEIVCRASPPPTGSRLGGGRECHTVRQWNEREREDQRIVQQQQSVGMNSGGK